MFTTIACPSDSAVAAALSNSAARRCDSHSFRGAAAQVMSTHSLGAFARSIGGPAGCLGFIDHFVGTDGSPSLLIEEAELPSDCLSLSDLPCAKSGDAKLD